MTEHDNEQAAIISASDQVLSGLDEQVDRFIWFWRLCTYKNQCSPEGCGVGDPTLQAAEFANAIYNAFEPLHNGFLQLSNMLMIAIRNLSKASPAQPPEHQWIAADDTNAHCSCGWHSEASDREEAEREWVEHAGDHTLVLQDWQKEYLEHVE